MQFNDESEQNTQKPQAGDEQEQRPILQGLRLSYPIDNLCRDAPWRVSTFLNLANSPKPA